MNKRLILAGMVLTAMMFSFMGCDILGGGIIREETLNNDINGDGIPDDMWEDTDGDGIPDDMHTDKDGDGIPDDKQDYEKGSIRITPKVIDISGAKGFVVFDNTAGVKTRAESEDVPKSPYALYTIDENGQIKLTVFHFAVETNEEGEEVEMQKEISEAIQLVPKLMTDMGDYILFSLCSMQIVNPDKLSEESLNICNSIIDDDWRFSEIFGCQPEYKSRLTYLVRKSDGAMFDLTMQPIFTYQYREIDYINGYENLHFSDGWWHDPAAQPMLSQDMYQISDKGHIFTSSGKCVYKISGNSDSIDVSSMTQDVNHERFVIDSNENIFIPVWSLHGASADYIVYIYKSAGGFNMSDLGDGLYLDMQKDDNGDLFLLGTREHFNGIKVASLKDGNCDLLYESNPDDDSVINSQFFYFNSCRDENAFGTSTGWDNGKIRWFYGSYRLNEYIGVQIAYDTRRNELKTLPVPTAIEDAMREKYDAISIGKYNVGVKLGSSSIEITDFDIAAGTVGKRTYEVDAMKNLVGKKCLISRAIPVILIYGKSTADGTDVHISVDLHTGQNLATYENDSRNVVSLVRIN